MEIDACARPRREYTLPPPTVFSVHPSSSRAGVALQDIREFAVSRESRVLGTHTSVSLATKFGADLSPRIPRVDAIERLRYRIERLRYRTCPSRASRARLVSECDSRYSSACSTGVVLTNFPSCDCFRIKSTDGIVLYQC